MSKVVTTHYPVALDKLPSSWATTTVGDVLSDIQPGFASGVHNQEGIGIPHLRPMNVDRDGRLDLTVVKYVSGSNPLRVKVGDVLFNNTNSAELIGKTAHIGIEGDFAFSNHMTRLRPVEGVDARFVAYQLHFLWMTGYFQHRCTHHVNQASVASTALAETVPFAVAPSNEQLRIVEEMEKQFTRLDAAVAAIKRVRANLKRYRAAVLKAACEGRLVPTEAELARHEGRSYEPASVLLERIIAERNQKRSPAEPDMTDPPPLPEGWTYASIDQMVSELTSGSRDWSPFYGRGSSVFLMAQNVRPGWLDLSFRQLVGPPRDDPSRTRSQVRKDDLLVTIVGANTGDACRVPIALPEHFVCQSVALMRPVLSETSVFLDLYLNSQEHGVRQFKRYIYGAGRPHLRFDQLMMTCVVLPPLAEQARIAAEVQRRLSFVDEMQGQIQLDLLRAARLRESLLKCAFEGKLVPQDANDEPASVLLERIRSERKAEPKPSTPRGRRKKEAVHVR